MTQLSLTLATATQPVAPDSKGPATIDERYNAFVAANPHVFVEALRLARKQLDGGAKYISVKAIFETMRTSVRTVGEGPRLNNDFHALLSRELVIAEPRLAGVIRMRRRKGESE